MAGSDSVGLYKLESMEEATTSKFRTKTDVFTLNIENNMNFLYVVIRFPG